MMATNPGFQISIDVKGRSCLVLGGDAEAAEKARRLLDAGAKVTVINPMLNDELRRLTATGKIIHRVRTFRATDADGTMLVINTLTGDRDYAKSLYELAQKERFLLCSTDQPELSTCMMPALINRGHLRLAVSTSGVAPALASHLRQDLETIFDLASHLRQDLETIFDEEFQSFVEWLKKLREEVQATEPDDERRRARLREAVEGFEISATVTYPRAWLEERAKQS
jgi:precorrin-2 dehydrogenase / sirohydrochlorin ferrochelatase